MLPEDQQRMMLAYLASLKPGLKLKSLEDLAALSSHELLTLARRIDDPALGLFIQLLKSTRKGTSLFEKLMGDHEEDNRPLVDEFFSRYLKSVLSASESVRHFNPLEAYLPAETFDDLAFVQSRQPFFLRQRIEVVNEYLEEIFGSPHHFLPGEQEQAWSYFWEKLISR